MKPEAVGPAPRTGAVNTPADPAPTLAPAARRFRDRSDAGRRLAELLVPLAGEGTVVIGIPRGGVPVAAEVARALGAPLDITVVRKIGAPRNPELALGAVAEGNVRAVAGGTLGRLGVSRAEFERLAAAAEAELAERSHRYRGARPPADLSGRNAILVDDGLATGSSARAAIESLRARGAARVTLAVPVGAPEALDALRSETDAIVCVEAPPDLWAVGLWYEDFSATADTQVAALLAELGTA